MILTAFLTAAVAWCLFCGSLPPLPLGLLCGGLGVALALLGRHTHGGVLSVDVLAQRSRLGSVNAALKTWGCLGLLLLCVLSRSAPTGLALALILLLLTVGAGGVPLGTYLSLMALPGAFLLLSALALLFSFGPAPVGVLNLPFFGGFLCVTPAAQAQAAQVTATALGAVSCLYCLSLSTPLSELIAVLRRAKVPAVVAELMYLIYRYIFLLLELHRTMSDAASSRLGYSSWRVSLHTTGLVYANLLSRSFTRAGACFDAMESRCYDGEIRFLEREKPLVTAHVLGLGGIFLLTAAVAVLGRLL